ncbi:FadR/GntR family transcriptional regulator [Yinghuangia seranimata]|uniref:FadR/GntR family transcriptional regulator n=1 Tax=Yinghuangia seranimata TaxID=408067 RepID=UPI00248BDE8A|nr:FadR/GntR family transcriptional regulator [Yinghuangia seranimata]MDI2129385.1 FadR/GntR family transcriptional regulator [Yinghuangia seranimata]
MNTAGNGQPWRGPKSSQRLAHVLAQPILSGEVREGDRLPNEQEMMALYGAGRPTVREALRLLETRGLIVLKTGPGGGPIVRRPPKDSLSEGLSLVLQVEGASFADVTDARIALEPMIARRAAERITDEQLAQLDDSVRRLRDHPGDHAVFVAENQRFHTLIAEAAQSVVLDVFVRTLQTIADGVRVGVQYSARKQAAIATAHAAIVDALRDRDPERAERAMRDHLAEAERYWRHRYPELMTRPVQWTY